MQGDLGDSQYPLLQADLGTYNTLGGCITTQQKEVLAGGFASAEEAEANVTALRAAMVFDPMVAQMHNQFGLVKVRTRVGLSFPQLSLSIHPSLFSILLSLTSTSLSLSLSLSLCVCVCVFGARRAPCCRE